MNVQAFHSWRTWMWCLWLVAAMISLAFLDLTFYGLVVPVSALVLAVISGPGVLCRVPLNCRSQNGMG